MERPLVSVLFACRDAARFLPEALAGLEGQSYRPIELIAVDDGSADATGAILAAFAAGRPWVRVLRSEGVGPAAARALAFGEARGPLLAIHDADDVSRSDRLERQVVYLQSHPDVGVLGTNAEVIDERGDRLASLPAPTDPDRIRRALRRAPPFVHGSVLLRREAYEAAGGYRAGFRVSEDYDLWLRIPARFGLRNLPDRLYRWRLHGTNTMSTQRTAHLEYLAIARAFEEERRRTGSDSEAALRAAPGLDAFRRHYAFPQALARYRAEAYVREGRTTEGRAALGPAWSSRDPALLAIAAAWWLLSWPVALTPRARRRRAEARAAAPREQPAA